MAHAIRIESMTHARKLAAILAAGALVAAAASPVQALASQTGTGETELVVTLEDASERGGTAAKEPFANPDDDHDGLGDNIAFTVPVSINFTANAKGVLTGPSEQATYIENESAYPIRVSSVDVDAAEGWNIVADASASSSANSIDVQFGPAANMLDASAYLSKANVGTPAAWGMSAADAPAAADRIQLKTAGDIAHIDKNIATSTKFGTIKWYVTPGKAS